MLVELTDKEIEWIWTALYHEIGHSEDLITNGINGKPLHPEVLERHQSVNNLMKGTMLKIKPEINIFP